MFVNRKSLHDDIPATIIIFQKKLQIIFSQKIPYRLFFLKQFVPWNIGLRSMIYTLNESVINI